MTREALITGIPGQDGGRLAELHVDEDDTVAGDVRRASLERIGDRVALHEAHPPEGRSRSVTSRALAWFGPLG